MKELTIPAAKLTIAECDDYSLALTRKFEEEEHEELSLYKVVLETTVYVLAEDEEGATSQAHCAVKDAREAETTAKVEYIPFLIRGWSNNRF